MQFTGDTTPKIAQRREPAADGRLRPRPRGTHVEAALAVPRKRFSTFFTARTHGSGGRRRRCHRSRRRFVVAVRGGRGGDSGRAARRRTGAARAAVGVPAAPSFSSFATQNDYTIAPMSVIRHHFIAHPSIENHMQTTTTVELKEYREEKRRTIFKI